MATLTPMSEIASLAEAGYNSLRNSILSCDILPGTTVTESAVMERLKVSRSTCRLALVRLMQEGFVRSLPRQGYLVVPITLSDVEELFALRLLLEPEAARLAAGRVDAERLLDLENKRRVAMAAAPQTERRDRMSIFIDGNEEFHSFIAIASGNSRLAKNILQLLDEMKRLVAFGFVGKGHIPEIADDHLVLIEALRTHHVDEAARLCHQHIVRVRDATLERVLDSIRGQEHALAPMNSKAT
jgi:DNA-binding GntR family transcriptional regulator